MAEHSLAMRAWPPLARRTADCSDERRQRGDERHAAPREEGDRGASVGYIAVVERRLDIASG
jgi:hypothetical protein